MFYLVISSIPSSRLVRPSGQFWKYLSSDAQCSVGPKKKYKKPEGSDGNMDLMPNILPLHRALAETSELFYFSSVFHFVALTTLLLPSFILQIMKSNSNSNLSNIFFQEPDNSSFWRRKEKRKRKKKQDGEFPVAEFVSRNLKKMEEAALGPGGGIGIGCGVGLGFGFTGGVGYSGGSWNHLKMVFGVGIGCGVGVGLGFGQGVGLGWSLESVQSHFTNKSSRSRNSDVMTLW